MLIRNSRRKPLSRLALASAAIGLFLVGYYWGNQYKRGDSVSPTIAGVLVHPARPLPGFELWDAADQPFTVESLAERWTLLSFGELDQASGHLAVTRMIEVHNRLASDPGLQEMLQLALAAERQDPALAQDFARLSPALKLLSGESGEMQRLGASLGAPAKEAAGTSTDEIPLFLIGPSGRLLALFPGAQAAASIASDLAAIAAHSDTRFPTRD